MPAETARGSLERDCEIDFRECIEIVIKRKKVVLAIFFVSVFLAAAWSLILPKIYEVSTIIEPPINAITDTRVQGWDPALDIKARIESGAENLETAGGPNLPGNELNFDVSIPGDASSIKISLKESADKADAANEC